MSFSFGGSTATAAPATGSTGFSFGGGSTSTSATPAAPGGFSFGGGTTSTSATPAASGGFSFGGGTTSTSAAPAASGGFSFGGASATPAPAASGGFGFGASATTSTTAAPSLFGGATTSTAAKPSGFSFGGAAATPATTTTPGFGFGASAAPASTGGSLFGATSTAAKPTGFGFGGGSSFGAQTQQTTGFGGFGTAATTAPAQPAGPPITLETAFEVLPADVQKNMSEFHAYLKEQDQSDAFLKTVSPRQMEALQANMARLEQDVLTRRNRQDRQAAAVQHVRQDVRQLLHQVDAATLSRRSLESSRSGSGAAPNLYHILRRVEMPSPYYWELLDHYEHKMAALKAQIESVEAEFKPLYDGRSRLNASANAGASPAPAQLQQILLAQNAALMQAAARVAEVHEKAEELRQLFLAKMQADLERHGEKNPAAFQNPFDKRKKSSEAHKRQAIDKIRFRTSVAPTIVTPPQPQQPQQPATSAFGFPSATAAPATSTTSTGGFGFGGFGASATTATSAAAPAKQVSFNLSSSATPAAATTTLAAPAPASGFATPTVATGGFGSIASSFQPPATDSKTTGSKRGGRAQKKRL